MQRAAIDDLRTQIRNGLDSGTGKTAEGVFARLEGKYTAMIQEQGHGGDTT